MPEWQKESLLWITVHKGYKDQERNCNRTNVFGVLSPHLYSPDFTNLVDHHGKPEERHDGGMTYRVGNGGHGDVRRTLVASPGSLLQSLLPISLGITPICHVGRDVLPRRQLLPLMDLGRFGVIVGWEGFLGP